MCGLHVDGFARMAQSRLKARFEYSPVEVFKTAGERVFCFSGARMYDEIDGGKPDAH
jgi:hypothetical protein